jgi:phage FluMu protein Com
MAGILGNIMSVSHKVNFRCPHCNASLNAELTEETQLECPVCRQIFQVSPDELLRKQEDDILLAPSTPEGYLNMFDFDE